MSLEEIVNRLEFIIAEPQEDWPMYISALVNDIEFTQED